MMLKNIFSFLILTSSLFFTNVYADSMNGISIDIPKEVVTKLPDGSEQKVMTFPDGSYVKEIRHPDGSITSIVMDSRGRSMTEERSPDGKIISTTGRDEKGNIVKDFPTD